MFRNYPEWGWEKFLLAHTCSPTLTLDEDAIPKEIVTHMVRTDATVDDANISNVQVAMKTLVT